MQQSSGQCEAQYPRQSRLQEFRLLALREHTNYRARVDTQFCAEFFNVLNHPNFQGPFDTNTIDQPGALLHTIGDARDIQFALKVIF